MARRLRVAILPLWLSLVALLGIAALLGTPCIALTNPFPLHASQLRTWSMGTRFSAPDATLSPDPQSTALVSNVQTETAKPESQDTIDQQLHESLQPDLSPRRALLQGSNVTAQANPPQQAQGSNKRPQEVSVVTEASLAKACDADFLAISNWSSPGFICFPTVGVLGRAEELHYLVEVPAEAHDNISFRVVLTPLNEQVMSMCVPQVYCLSVPPSMWPRQANPIPSEPGQSDLISLQACRASFFHTF
jgi:hypothetical protein